MFPGMLVKAAQLSGPALLALATSWIWQSKIWERSIHCVLPTMLVDAGCRSRRIDPCGGVGKGVGVGRGVATSAFPSFPLCGPVCWDVGPPENPAQETRSIPIRRIAPKERDIPA